MVRKKRRFFYYYWAVLIALVPLYVNVAIAEKSKTENAEPIFVFPSMQMEGLDVASKDTHVPMVEIVYRGQPPVPPVQEEKVTSTTISSREVITSASPQTTRGKFSLWHVPACFLSGGFFCSCVGR